MSKLFIQDKVHCHFGHLLYEGFMKIFNFWVFLYETT